MSVRKDCESPEPLFYANSVRRGFVKKVGRMRPWSVWVSF